jgi:hypothetical protein
MKRNSGFYFAAVVIVLTSHQGHSEGYFDP